MGKNVVELIFTAKEQGANSAVKDLKKNLIGLVGAWASVEAARKAFDLGKEAAKLKDITKAYNNLATSAGINANKMLRSMQEATRGVITEMELMQQFSQASLLGLPLDRFDEMLQIARGASIATGQSMEFMLNSIVVALGRGSKLMLDNLGILIDVEGANVKYAESIGKTSAELNDFERKQAFINTALDIGNDNLKRMGGAVDAATDSYGQAATEAKELGLNLGMVLEPATSAVARAFSGAVGPMNDFFESFATSELERSVDLLERLGAAAEDIEGLRGLIEAEERMEAAAGATEAFEKAIAKLSTSTQEMTNIPVGAQLQSYGVSVKAQESATKNLDDSVQLLISSMGGASGATEDQIEWAKFLAQAYTETATEAINAGTAAGIFGGKLRGEGAAAAADAANLLALVAAFEEMKRARDEAAGVSKFADDGFIGPMRTGAAPALPDFILPGDGEDGDIIFPNIVPPDPTAQQEAMDQLLQMRNEAVLSEQELEQAHTDNLLRMAGDSEEARTLIAEMGAARRRELVEEELAAEIQAITIGLGAIETIARSQGKSGFMAAQAFGVARATISMLQGAAEALKLGWPASIVPMAHTLALGATQINRLKGIKAPQAHAGLTNVPQDQTFLLKQNERVLAPQQNTDLTQFLADQGQSQGSRSVDVGGISIEVHAERAEDIDWESVLADEIVPGVERALEDGLINFPLKNIVNT